MLDGLVRFPDHPLCDEKIRPQRPNNVQIGGECAIKDIMSETQPGSADQSASTGIPISLARLIPLVLAALVVLAVLPVLVTGYVISSNTASGLLADRAKLIVDGLENNIRSQLDPVSQQLLYARRSFLEGIIDAADAD